MVNRRKFIKTGVAATGVLLTKSFLYGKSGPGVPSYLKGYEEIFSTSPRMATMKMCI